MRTSAQPRGVREAGSAPGATETRSLARSLAGTAALEPVEGSEPAQHRTTDLHALPTLLVAARGAPHPPSTSPREPPSPAVFTAANASSTLPAGKPVNDLRERSNIALEAPPTHGPASPPALLPCPMRLQSPQLQSSQRDPLQRYGRAASSSHRRPLPQPRTLSSLLPDSSGTGSLQAPSPSGRTLEAQ